MRIFDAACALKAALEAAFADDPFGRAYVSDGSANWELDEALIVEFDSRQAVPLGGSPGSSPADMSSGSMALRALFTVHALRYTVWPASDEAGNPPEPWQVQDNAKRVLCDCETVVDALLAGMRDNTLFGVCGKMELVSQAAVVPEGFVVGSETKVLVTL